MSTYPRLEPHILHPVIIISDVVHLNPLEPRAGVSRLLLRLSVAVRGIVLIRITRRCGFCFLSWGFDLEIVRGRCRDGLSALRTTLFGHLYGIIVV